MTFFQNVFSSEYLGNLLLDDKQYVLTFKCRPNSGRGPEHVVVHNQPNYDLSGNDTESNSCAILNIAYAKDPELKLWQTLSIDITAEAASSSAVTSEEIAEALNDNEVFSSIFVATTSNVFTNTKKSRLMIKQKDTSRRMSFYIVNGQAEEKLGFNKFAGVDELPVYFSRHTISNVLNEDFPDCTGMLIELDPSNNVDAAVINNAVNNKGVSLGYNSSSVQEDWQLLGGRSGIFNFQKITVDGSDRITEIIEYHAGAKEGDFARKIMYNYTGANKNASETFEIPYVLTNSDLITP